MKRPKNPPKKLGKAAYNEQLKIKATFMNNTAVGLLVAGFFIPYISVIGKVPELMDFLDKTISGSLGIADPFLSIVLNAGPPVVALWAASLLHAGAVKELEKIKD